MFSVDKLFDDEFKGEPVATDGYTGPFSPWAGQGTVTRTYNSAGVSLIDVTFPQAPGIWTYET